MEFAQFGDTEIPLSSFKTALEKLNSGVEGRSLSRMEEEFEVRSWLGRGGPKKKSALSSSFHVHGFLLL
jgi:hypothetical protein